MTIDAWSRLLADRTRALATRGRALETDAVLLDRMICIAGGRHYALEPATVTAILRHACYPVPLTTPRAARVMLGLMHHGGRLLSVLDLAHLLSPTDTASPPTETTATGLALIVDLPGRPPIALRVESVLGMLALQPGMDGQAVIISGTSSGVLATLVTDARLHDVVAALDGRPPASPVPGA